MNFFTCRDIKVDLVNDTGPGLTFYDSEENAASEVADAYLETANKNYKNYKIVSVMNLSDSVNCLSGNHFITIVISVFVIVFNIIFKYISNRILKFLPRKNILNSKYGQTDILYDICLNLIVISNVVSKKYLTDIFFLQGAYLAYCIFLLLAFFVNHFFHPFYHHSRHNLRSF